MADVQLDHALVHLLALLGGVRDRDTFARLLAGAIGQLLRANDVAVAVRAPGRGGARVHLWGRSGSAAAREVASDDYMEAAVALHPSGRNTWSRPLLHQAHAIGALVLDAASNADAGGAILDQIAGLAALSLANIEAASALEGAVERSEAHARQVEVMHRIALTFLRSPGFDVACDEAARAIAAALGWSHVWIDEASHTGDLVVLGASAAPIPAAEGDLAWLALRRDGLVTAAEAEWRGARYELLRDGFGVAVPIRFDTRRRGVLTVGAVDRREPCPSELDSIRVVADALAVSSHAARAQHRATVRRDALVSALRALAAPHPDAVSQVLSVVQRATSVSAISLELVTPEFHQAFPTAAAVREVERCDPSLAAGRRFAIPVGERVTGWLVIPTLDALALEEGDIAFFETIARELGHVMRCRSLEVEIRESQKMQAVGQLAGGIAHEFNNVLAAMLGNLDFIGGAIPPGEYREALEDVRGAAIRAGETTRNLLGFSRRGIDARAPLDVGACVRDALRLLRRTIPGSISIVVEAEHGAGVVLADRTELEHVIINLVTNARDAMNNGGSLHVAVFTRKMSGADIRGERRADHFVVLSVTDTGCGIPDDVLPRIFEPFFTTKPQGQGTGMGLATVYGAVHRLNGWIEVETSRGCGTRVDVYIPFYESNATREPAVADALAKSLERS
jgi:signal transduction histidine kinase